MSNQFTLAGGQPQKQTRFAPIYTGRWSSGLWTNRSPLRDANTTRLVEKFYGPSGDALIAGLNVEVTNRLTLARRYGNSLFDSNSYNSVGFFDSFRITSPTTEIIKVMVDEANTLSALYNSVKSTVWTKSTGAGQTYMQTVGNSLYFGNGVDNKKWLQTPFSWSAAAQWGIGTTPFMTTFLIDTNGNIQQLTATNITISNVQVASNVLTITSALTNLTSVLSVGLTINFSSVATATFLNGTSVTITGVTGTTFTAAFTHANYGPTADTGNATVAKGGTPISGAVQPTWNTTVPAVGNNFAGGTTQDGSVQWTNRGNPVKNWGIAAPTSAPSPSVGSSRVAWKASTYYSVSGVIIDSNGNLQQVQTAGKSGTTTPTWATVLNNTTTDGTVTWKLIQLAASLTWAAHTAYAAGSYVVGNAGGTNCLFQLAPQNAITFSVNPTAYFWPANTHNGSFSRLNPLNTGTSSANVSGTSLLFNTGTRSTTPMVWMTLNGAGEVTGSIATWIGAMSYFDMVVTGTFNVPQAGQYSFTFIHDDGLIFGIGNGAQKVSGPFNDPYNHTGTAVNNYPVMGGTNIAGYEVAGSADVITVNFPTAGTYGFEIDYTQKDSFKEMTVLVGTAAGNTTVLPTPLESGTNQPVWPAWSTSYAPNYPNVTEVGSIPLNPSYGPFVWNNLGPTADDVWSASINYTTPNTTIIDANGNTEAPYRAGNTGTAVPTWATGQNQLTTDNPNLIWINQGVASAPSPGTLSTFNGGWQYGVALVNTLDNTVSNLSNLSVATGNFIGAAGVTIPAGSGLTASSIDPQSDYVAIFRTLDGQVVPFLIDGTLNSIYTIPLSTYLTSGYTDTTVDTNLNNLIQGAQNGENTPPAAGAINLAYHLNRIFYSIGNVVYWTTGSLTPVGNGVNGTSPANFDTFPSFVKRIVPTASGALVFTISDVYVIPGQGTVNNPIQQGQLILKDVGLLNYNALDINGSIIGLYTADRQFIVLDPTSGVSYNGQPIGDRLRLNNGSVGTSWNPATAYVTWHVQGEDQAWYISDSTNGWYRLMTTPAPETGLTWSTFANITGGAKAVQSIEVSPGNYQLLIGPTGTGSILKRDLTTFADNGTSYSAYAVIGSMNLCQPGQVAEVSFVTTDAVNTGTPLFLGILVDEALPYYTGPFDVLTDWVTDPPGLPQSKSILGQRFYLSELRDYAAVCRHMQVQVNWIAENAASELLAMTVYGAYKQEI